MKHELRFTIQSQGFRRELIIDTDSVDDFTEAGWFRQFLGLNVATQVREEPVRVELTAEQKRAMMEREIAEANKTIEAQRRTVPVPPRPMPVQRPALPQSSMELNPDQMTADIWNSFSPQQQAEYQSKWLGQR